MRLAYSRSGCCCFERPRFQAAHPAMYAHLIVAFDCISATTTHFLPSRSGCFAADQSMELISPFCSCNVCELRTSPMAPPRWLFDLLFLRDCPGCVRMESVSKQRARHEQSKMTPSRWIGVRRRSLKVRLWSSRRPFLPHS